MQYPLRPMPAGLEALPDLALNVRWTWSHASDKLWQELAPDVWAATRNPWLILQIVPQSRLEECSRSPDFLANVAQMSALRAEYLSHPSWCSQCEPANPPLVAYFCLEFGFAEAMPIYAGGLGVLAGDHLKTASDLGIPMVGVGLLYSEGYFRQVLDAEGNQQELFPPNAPSTLPITPALDASGAQLFIPLALPGRSLTVRVWQVQVGRVKLLLLDCNDPRNSPADRGITATLYPAALETRFVQQMVLGIGGWRALQALGYAPAVCHINEGHAALVTIERIRWLMRDQSMGFHQALWTTRPGNAFTTHTPVAAAFDTFSTELVLKYLRGYLAESAIGEHDFLALASRDPREQFNPSYLALRTCGRINAVSQVHADVSRQLFLHVFARRPVSEVPIGYITNGVHVPSWDSAWADDVWTQACGKHRWHGGVDELAPPIDALDDRVLWDLKSRERADLVRYVRQRLVQQLRQRGTDGQWLDESAHVLDPNALTIGFARRFTAYKRPNLLLHDPDRLARLLGSGQRPIQLIVAGKAHPQDEAGKAMIRQWVQFCRRPDARARVVFLEDYDIDLARELVKGIDVWINTPRRPWEACGTSGMKVLVNGGLNLSELDGWWAEAYSDRVGWKLESTVSGDESDVNDHEAEMLYRLLEEKILPLFYQRNAEGIAQGWVAMMRASMSTLAPRFSSNRMLHEYFQSVYCPAGAAFARRSADHGRLAGELQAWETALRAGWHEIRLGNYDCRRSGDRLVCNAHVYLGEIGPEAVAVELYADPADSGPPEIRRLERRAAISGAMNAFAYGTEFGTARPARDYTLRVVPCHPQAMVPLETDLIHWAAPD